MHNYPDKSLLSPSPCEHIIHKPGKAISDASFACGGQLHKDPPTAIGSARQQKWSQGENVINLKAAAQTVRAKDKEGARKGTDDQLSPFCVSLHGTGDFSFTRPPQGQETKAVLWCVFSHCIFTWGQNCNDKTLLFVWFRTLVVKGQGMFYVGGYSPDA